MSALEAAEIRSLLISAAHPLPPGAGAYDPLLDVVGNARFILLGAASNGTHEFHRARAEITKSLILEKGFRGVAVEADGADARLVDRWVRGAADGEAADALSGFRRFPSWVFRNADVLDFVDWLRQHNDGIASDADKAGFYGLDAYGLHSSMEAVIGALRRTDPDAAHRVEARYACFDRFGGDAQGYGASALFGTGVSCEDAVIAALVERHGEDGASEARAGDQAEKYYRAMLGSPAVSWNLRDRHMAESLDALSDRLSREGEPAKLVVWAHNAHLGDARATEMGEHGELSLGQLVRLRRGADAVLVGLTTDTGTVTAATAWDGPARRRRLRPALEGSYEALFREVPHPRFLLKLHESREMEELLSERRLERAVGAIYRPETERTSHYFGARLPRQFDAVLHFDHTRAVEPVERTSLWMAGEPPETHPA